MTAKEAMEVVAKEYQDKSIVECIEFPDFYGFALTDKGKENESFGGGYITVNKKDKSLSVFNPTMNFQLFMSAKQIDLNLL